TPVLRGSLAPALHLPCPPSPILSPSPVSFPSSPPFLPTTFLPLPRTPCRKSCSQVWLGPPLLSLAPHPLTFPFLLPPLSPHHLYPTSQNASAENLARKFGSDPKTTSFTLIFGVLRDFVDLLKKNLVEYEKKKKAEEEAAKEKAQPKAKASGKHNHSPSLFCLPHYPSSHLPPVFSVLRDFVDLFKKNLVEYEKKKKADEEATKDFADQFPVSISFSWALVDEQDELGGGLHGRCWQGRSRGGEHRWMRMKTVRMMTGVIRGGGVWAAGMTTGVAMEMGAGGSAGAGRGDHEESSCGG
ncbi:unnamed protein product, partial [Closterium sp. NIES-65]